MGEHRASQGRPGLSLTNQPRDPTQWGRAGPQVARPAVGADSWGGARTFGHQELRESLDALGSLLPRVLVGRRPLAENGGLITLWA